MSETKEPYKVSGTGKAVITCTASFDDYEKLRKSFKQGKFDELGVEDIRPMVGMIRVNLIVDIDKPFSKSELYKAVDPSFESDPPDNIFRGGGNAESSTYGFRYASGTAANEAKSRIESAFPNAVVRIGQHPFGTLA